MLQDAPPRRDESRNFYWYHNRRNRPGDRPPERDFHDHLLYFSTFLDRPTRSLFEHMSPMLVNGTYRIQVLPIINFIY